MQIYNVKNSSFDVNNGKQTGVRYVFAQGKGCSFEENVFISYNNINSHVCIYFLSNKNKVDVYLQDIHS